MKVLGAGAAVAPVLRSADPPYSLVVFPDEQFLAIGGPQYSRLTDWVVNNRHTTTVDGSDLNIVGVVSVGDCANTAGANEASGECAVVKTAYEILDRAEIPFICPPGNHDYVPGANDLSERILGANFKAGGIFSPSARSRHGAFGGSYDEDNGVARTDATGANWWISLHASGRSILVIALELFPRDAVVTWARSVHDAHPGYECIVTTHGYLTDTGLQADRTVTYGPHTYNLAAGSPSNPAAVAYGLSGQEMWGSAPTSNATNPFKTWSNLTAILSGHYIYGPWHNGPRASKRYQRVAIQSSSPRGQTVHQFYSNAQDLDSINDSDGANLCILRFIPSDGVLNAYWLSVKSSKWSPDSVSFVSVPKSATPPALETGVPYPGVTALAAPKPAEPPQIAAVVNGASFMTGIAQGSWMTIQGSNLSPAPPRTWRLAEIVDGYLPKRLDGVSVEVNGRPAAVCYISPQQINAVAPDDDSLGPVAVRVTVNGAVSPPAVAELRRYAPALFLWNSRAVVATHADFTPAAHPEEVPGATLARPGEIVVLWGTGFGKTAPAVPADRLVTDPAFVPDPVLVHFEDPAQAGSPALGVALAPGFAALYQVAVRIPDFLPPGDVRVWVEIGGVASQAGLLSVAAG